MSPIETAEQPQLLRVTDAARRLNVSRATTYRWIRAGTLPALRVGDSLRIDADELDAYIFGEDGE